MAVGLMEGFIKHCQLEQEYVDYKKGWHKYGTYIGVKIWKGGFSKPQEYIIDSVVYNRRCGKYIASLKNSLNGCTKYEIEKVSNKTFGDGFYETREKAMEGHIEYYYKKLEGLEKVEKETIATFESAEKVLRSWNEKS